jgi:hypothetical protein
MVSTRDPRLALAAGGAAFLVHNSIDFGAYLPGIAIPAALLLGMVLGPSTEDAAERTTINGAAWMRIASASLATLLLLAIVIPQARSRASLNAARDAALTGDLTSAAEMARHAAEVRPTEPDAWAFLAEMTLAHRGEEAIGWEAGEAASLRSVQLDPESAIRHYTRALYYLADGAAAAAYREQAIAHRLFPLKELYRLPEAPARGGLP